MKDKNIILILIIYSISHFLILADQGIFWDDWTLFGSPVDDVFDQFQDNGRVAGGLLIKAVLLSEFPVLLSKTISFLVYLLAALLLYKILLTIKVLSRQDSFILTVLFAIFPVNFARLTLVCLQYGLSYFFFFLGFYIVSKYIESGNILFRVLALLIFPFGFLMESLIPFYGIILLYIAYKNQILNNQNILNIPKIGVFILKYLDFFILPVVFWFLNKKLFPVSDSFKYEGYNTIQLTKILSSPLDYILVVQESFFNLLYRAFSLALSAVIPFVILVFIFNYILKNNIIRENHSVISLRNTHLKVLFIMALVTSFLGAFPYIVVNKLPLPFEFISRHQILLPLGFALFFYLIIIVVARILPRLSLNFVFACAISVLSFYNISHYLDFKRDWLEQQALLHYISKTPVFKSRTTFVFEDNSGMSVDNRGKRFYEYAGYFKHIFGDQTRIGFDSKHERVSQAALMVHIEDPFYNIKDYKIEKPQYLITIKEGSYIIGPIEGLKMQFQYYFNPEAYYRNLPKILSISYSKI